MHLQHSGRAMVVLVLQPGGVGPRLYSQKSGVIQYSLFHLPSLLHDGYAGLPISHSKRKKQASPTHASEAWLRVLEFWVQLFYGIELEAVGLQFEPYRWRPCGVTWHLSRTVVVIKLRRTSALRKCQSFDLSKSGRSRRPALNTDGQWNPKTRKLSIRCRHAHSFRNLSWNSAPLPPLFHASSCMFVHAFDTLKIPVHRFGTRCTLKKVICLSISGK